MKPFSKQELDVIRKACSEGHHIDFVVRLVDTIDSLQRKLTRTEAAVRELVAAADE